MLIPGLILGYLAFRGLQNDQALRDKQNQQELRLLAIDVFDELESRIEGLKSVMATNPDLKKGLVLIGWEKGKGSDPEITGGELLYYPDGTLTDLLIGNHDELNPAQKLEFVQKDYAGAVREYERIAESSDKKIVIAALLGESRE